MFGWRQMPHEIDVRRPREVVRILRAADQEAPVRRAPRRLDEQRFERCLPVFRIGAEIGEIGAIVRLCRRRPMHVGIDMAVERCDVAGTELVPELLEDVGPPVKLRTRSKSSQTVAPM